MDDTGRTLVLAVASQVVGRPVSAEESFFDVGGDSLLAVDLALQLEAATGAQIDFDFLLDGRTFGELADSLAQFGTGSAAGPA
ncbi:acyl carrier protein [Kitasatospora purpeofusca]|uniref:acyl carrier protein n=1 Tax=Kitasatospora purpeofusca TaxID=67352 RepID=UPI0035DC4376